MYLFTVPVQFLLTNMTDMGHTRSVLGTPSPVFVVVAFGLPKPLPNVYLSYELAP